MLLAEQPLCVVDVGPRDGEPIVLVAGFSQSIEQAWGTTGVIDALDGDHRVIALDLLAILIIGLVAIAWRLLWWALDMDSVLDFCRNMVDKLNR